MDNRLTRHKIMPKKDIKLRLLHVYKISRGYKRCTVWSGSKMTHEMLVTSVLVPDKILNRRQRYAAIFSWLVNHCGLPGPCYREKDAR